MTILVFFCDWYRIGFMKHIISLIAALTLLVSSCFCAEKAVGVSVSHNFKRGIERALTSYAVEGCVKGERVGVFTGFQANDLLADFTLMAEYWTIIQKLDCCTLRYGIDAIYHYQHFRYEGETIVRENDFMADMCFSLTMDNDFTFSIRNGYGAKFSFLPALTDSITDMTPCVYIGVSKSFGAVSLEFATRTHTLYRYPLFCSPDYALTFAYISPKGIRSAVTGDFRISDQFTTAPYINRIALTLAVTVLIK